MASTLNDVLTGALTAIGQLGQGQSPSAEDAALGLRLANLFLTKIQSRRLFLSSIGSRQYALTASLADYSIGPTAPGAFAGVRPTFIEGAQVQAAVGGAWIPISIIDKREWDAIKTKDAVASIPDRIYVEYTYPNLQFHVNPSPNGAAQIRLGTWEPFTQFANIFTAINFPPAYEEMLESNLAVLYGPYYDRPIPPDLAGRANDAITSVMTLNAQALGGSLGEGQTLQSPNVGQPNPVGGPPAQGTPQQ